MIAEQRAIFTTALLLSVLVTGCSKEPKAEPEGYRVVGYDSRTHEYTIDRNVEFDGKYLVKRFVVRCVIFEWGKREPVRGEDACDLTVGRLYRWAHFNDQKQIDESVVEASSDSMTITTDSGPDKVQQTFDILSIAVLPDKNGEHAR